MKNKLFKIIETLLIIIVSGVGFYYFYNKLVDIHTSSCCEGINNCPIYLCSSNSPELTKYSIFATITVFCGVLIILFIINIIRIMLKEDK